MIVALLGRSNPDHWPGTLGTYPNCDVYTGVSSRNDGGASCLRFLYGCRSPESQCLSEVDWSGERAAACDRMRHEDPLK